MRTADPKSALQLLDGQFVHLGGCNFFGLISFYLGCNDLISLFFANVLMRRRNKCIFGSEKVMFAIFVDNCLLNSCVEYDVVGSQRMV